MRAYVGLGANLGDARAAVRAGLAALGALPQTRLAAASSLYTSAPVDADGPDFVNAAAALDTALDARALLAALLAIEARHGRARPYRNAPRTLDLDLLLFGDTVSDDPLLTLPHPRMAGRAFVLVPLAEIAPGLALPGGARVATLAAALAGQTVIRLPEESAP
ncbi:MAG: 2-amino-4-hydroxy-6-hydroxymethyldihydropteridine diphosphokinase [Burkholderiales bacterium]|nr:2-amino-4-hydroxy-6-hydroxymethyldihydropteridine diphosphokinase [Burkholderiales bacterium]